MRDRGEFPHIEMISALVRIVNTSVRHPSARRVLRRVYQALEDVFDGKVLAQNEKLKGRYAGERCFLICTGSSLKEINLSLIAEEYTFGCNLLIQHPDVRKHGLSFYAAMDPYFALLTDRDPTVRPAVFFPSIEAAFRDHKTLLFLHASGRRYIQKNGLLCGRDVYYVRGGAPMESALEQVVDLTRPITFMDGSVFFMMAAAVYMGFREIYLCGCGYTYTPLQSGHFYEDWTQIDDRPVDHRHQIAKGIADQQGVRIRNVVPDGFGSPVYEGVSWRWVVEHVLRARLGDASTVGSARL